MRVGPPGHGQLDAPDRRIVARVLQRYAVVAQRLDKALVVKDVRDAAAPRDQPGCQLHECRRAVAVQPYREVAHKTHVARGLQDHRAQLVDGIVPLAVHAPQCDRLHVIVQVHPACQLLHNLASLRPRQSSVADVRLVPRRQDLVQPADGIGIDPVLAAGQNVGQPERLHRFPERPRAPCRHPCTPLRDAFQTGALPGIGGPARQVCSEFGVSLAEQDARIANGERCPPEILLLRGVGIGKVGLGQPPRHLIPDAAKADPQHLGIVADRVVLYPAAGPVHRIGPALSPRAARASAALRRLADGIVHDAVLSGVGAVEPGAHGAAHALDLDFGHIQLVDPREGRRCIRPI